MRNDVLGLLFADLDGVKRHEVLDVGLFGHPVVSDHGDVELVRLGDNGVHRFGVNGINNEDLGPIGDGRLALAHL